MRHHISAFASARTLARPNLALLRFIERRHGPEEGGKISELVGERNIVFVAEAAVECVDGGAGEEVTDNV